MMNACSAENPQDALEARSDTFQKTNKKALGIRVGSVTYGSWKEAECRVGMTAVKFM